MSDRTLPDSLSTDPQLPGRYSVRRLLGEGGVGKVYLCGDRMLGADVAIKVLSPKFSADVEAVSLLRREAQVVAHLREHPRILPIYDLGRHRELVYVVMQYAPGGSLAERIVTLGPLPEPECIRIGIEIADALEYAHARGVLHGDIKPGNILFDGGDNVKVTDFGVASLMSRDVESDIPRHSISGTPAYMAPELLTLARHVDGRSDLYSLGVVLFEASTGHRPFSGSFAEVAMAKTSTSAAPDPSAVRRALSDAFGAVVAKLLSVDPAQRYATGRECVEGLRALVGSVRSEVHKDIVGTEKADGIHIESPEPLTTVTSTDGHNLRPREHDGQKSPGPVTLLRAEHPPEGFFAAAVFSRASFFKDEADRHRKIQETMSFYREELGREYADLLRQARITYQLWTACVVVGIGVMLLALGAVLMGQVTQGAAAGCGTILVYFVQKVFQQREDHYRALADRKHEHLVYGEKWSVAAQTIEAIPDEATRRSKLDELASVMTGMIKEHGGR